MGTEGERALAYAYRLLAYRARSVGEMEDRLLRRGFSSSVVGKTLDALKEHGYLDDGEFARAWIRDRIEQGRYGRRRIARDLKRKGIEGEILREALEEGFRNVEERETAMGIARSRLPLSGPMEPRRLKRRIYGLLLRRGFSRETTLSVCAEIFGE